MVASLSCSHPMVAPSGSLLSITITIFTCISLFLSPNRMTSAPSVVSSARLMSRGSEQAQPFPPLLIPATTDVPSEPDSSPLSRPIVDEYEASRSWKRLLRVLNHVYKNVCGHATLSEMKTLLLRNNLWMAAASKYVQSVVQRCPGRRTTTNPQPSRKVSLSSLWR